MRIILVFSFVILFFLIFIPKETFAQCSGTFTCNLLDTVCTHPVTGADCNPAIDSPCSCITDCTGDPSSPLSCSGFPQIQCGGATDPCVGMCGVLSNSCSWSSPPAHECFTSGDCGVNRQCCAGGAGGANYCTSTCYACNGSYICAAPTATPVPPTPTSAVVCTYGNCSSPGATAGSSDPGGYYSCDGTCWQWVNCPGGQVFNGTGCTGPTPTPTSPAPTSGGGGPAPTDPPSGGACGAGRIQCLPAAACYPDCCSCSGTIAFCDAPGCPPPSVVCGDGVCNGSEGCGTCPGDCGSCGPVCGNGVCESGESNSSCPADCPPPTYNISGTVFIDSNNSGTQNCSGSCNNGAGDELGYNGAVLTLNPGGSSRISNSLGNYGFAGQLGGNKTLTLTVPSGYVATSTNPSSFNLASNRTVNFGINIAPTPTPAAPNCSDNLDALPSIVEPDGAVSLDIEGCTNVENPPDGSTPPPYDWDPPQDDNSGDEGDPQCSDGIDNDGDGKIDTNDPRCHWDGDSTNPGSYDPNDDNESPADSLLPQCFDGVDNDGDGYVDYSSDPECTSATDDNESDRVSPNASGSMTCSDGGMVVNTTGLTSSTAIWTAPACPTAQQVCTISTTVGGPGGTFLSSTNVTVRRSGTIQAFIHDVSDGSACDASAPLYTGPAVLQLTGAVNTTETVADGSYEFVCLPDAGYTVTLGVPDGYQMSSPASNFQSTTINNNTQITRFCISNFEPWYQTEKGDIRMRGIINPIPAGLFGSTDASNPGVFHSTLYNAEVESGGGVSQKGWLINREYEYNELTANRNGTVAYSFYKSRARQEGVDVVELQNSTLDQNEIIDSGIYEYPGDLVINDYDHVGGRRVVILASGDITINTEIPVATGLLIVAAGGDIHIGATVGHPVASFSSTASNLDGYYTAEGNVILEGTQCASGVADERLNIAGAVIANARKPFASDGVNSIQNNRSLCSADDAYPTLYVSSRPDFLTQLTDFYKLSYTKWREVRP